MIDIVTAGSLKILFRDGEIILKAGESFIVPRGI
jgi:quercetin dioxygenase-like cupin family protein